MTWQGEFLIVALLWCLTFAGVVRWIRYTDNAAADRRDRTRRMIERERMRATYREGMTR